MLREKRNTVTLLIARWLNLSNKKMASIKIQEINDLISISFDNIKSHFRALGVKGGWHQYLGSEKIGNIATSQALMILDDFSIDFDRKYLAFETLLASQFHSDGNPALDGGWAYVTNFSDIPTTEATCWALLALHNNNRNSVAAKDGINWILQNQPGGTTDEGWGTIKTDKSRVYTTCLVIRVLKLYNYERTPQFERGINYLLKSQNVDGGWGERFGDRSTVTHTAHTIVLLIDAGGKSNPQAIKKGVNWLLNNFVIPENNSLIKNGGYQENIEFDSCLDGVSKHHRLTYYHLPVPYAIMALVKSGNMTNKNVFLGLQKLINDNNDGYWEHPHLADSKVKPLWAIYDSLVAFKVLMNATPGWRNLKEISFRNNKVTFENNTKPFNPKVFLKNFVFGIWGKIFVIIVLCVLASYTFKWFPKLDEKAHMGFVILPLIIELLGYYITETKSNKHN